MTKQLHILIIIFLFTALVNEKLFSQTYVSAFDDLDVNLNNRQGFSFFINHRNVLQVLEADVIEAYVNMYITTKNKKYLDQFIIHASRIQHHRDDDVNSYTFEIANLSDCPLLTIVPNDPLSKSWSDDHDKAPEEGQENDPCSNAGWVPRVLFSGRATYPMAHFVYLMKSDPEAMQLLNEPLPSEVVNSALPGTDCQTSLNTYSDFVNWLQCRVNSTLQYHNSYWCDDIGLYKHHLASDPCINTNSNPNGTEAPNMQCAIGKTLIMMHLVENLPGGNSTYAGEYLYKSELIAYKLRQVIDAHTPPNSNYYSWLHSEEDGPWTQDIGHASGEISFAELCYKYNITSLFTLNDMQKFANTFLLKFYDKPLLAHMNTFGTNIGQYDGYENPSEKTFIIGFYGFLIPYNAQVYQIINDFFSAYATKSAAIPADDQLGALNAYPYLDLYKKTLNPIAVMRNNQANKQWSGAAGGDFDGNGIEEIVTYNKSDGELQVYDLNTNKTITASQIHHNEGTQIADIGAGELTSTHTGDEVVAVTNSGGIGIFKAINFASPTPNTFFPVASYNLPSNIGYSYVGIEVGDILPNIPGNEIIVAIANGAPYVLSYNQTTNTINFLGQLTGGFIPSIPINNLTVGDFDPTTPGDEVCVAYVPGIYMYHVTSSLTGFVMASYSTGQTININNPWEAVTSGDYDGDGIDEMIVTKHDDGKATMLKYKNNALVEVTNEYFKPDQLISTAASFKKNGKDVVALLRDYDGQIAMFDMEGLCPSFYLNNQTINNSTSIDNIYTNVQNNYPIDYHAHNILAISDFHIAENGTTATFTAGKEISITNEFSSEEGTEMSAYIDNNLACTESVFRKAKPNEAVNIKTEEKKHNNLNSLNVYPNPTNGKAQLKYTASENVEINVTVLNINGQLIYEKTTNAVAGDNSIDLDLSYLENGIYFLNVENKASRNKQSGKIVVIK